MKRESFSFNEYKNIITEIQKHLPILDYLEIHDETEKFCILRHDVEFSIERA